MNAPLPHTAGLAACRAAQEQEHSLPGRPPCCCSPAAQRNAALRKAFVLMGWDRL